MSAAVCVRLLLLLLRTLFFSIALTSPLFGEQAEHIAAAVFFFFCFNKLCREWRSVELLPDIVFSLHKLVFSMVVDSLG
jgi:hypothetical protein